jgi:histone acetyltransferase MYST1
VKNKDRIVNSISVFEIKGEEHKLYCQNLCLIAKLFLDHKSIYYDVSPFKFYALTENDKNGKHIVAYFSKESSLCSEFNLACIMVLPPYQRKGYGQFLIALSYYFSKLEKRICTPETPLSDLGRISYKSYWTLTILETLLKYKGNLSIKELSEETTIKNEDIIYTLNELSLV